MYAATNKKGTNHCLSLLLAYWNIVIVLTARALVKNLFIAHDVDALLNSA